MHHADGTREAEFPPFKRASAGSSPVVCTNLEARSMVTNCLENSRPHKGRGFDSFRFRHPVVAQLGRGRSPRSCVVSVRDRSTGPSTVVSRSGERSSL